MKNGYQEVAVALAGAEAGSKPAASPARRARHALLPARMVHEGIWSRIVLLFVVLCLVKVALLLGLRRHLFEIHWRVGGEPSDWINGTGFYLFAVLVGLHLWRLGTQCQAAGKQAVRAANACALALGGAFIFLTFHEGHKNWLSPILNGVLTWRNVGWYLALDSFFRPPYLAGWILGYALAYYLMARTAREHLMLRITAVCACAYVAFYLHDFAKYHTALVVADSVGLACLVSSRGTRRPLGLVWMGLFVLGAGSLFVVFYGLDRQLTLGQEDPEFAILTGTSLVLLAGMSVLAWRCGFFSGWSWVLPFATTTFLLFVNVNYGPATNYHKLLCTSFTLPRYFLGEFILAASLFVLARVYRHWRPAASLLWLDAVSLILIAFALADLRLSEIMGARLDWQALSLALGETPTMMWRMARPYLASWLCGLLVAVGLYASVLWVLRRKDRERALFKAPPALSGGRFFLISFVLLGLAGEWLVDHDKAEGQSVLLLAETSPLWRRAVDPAMDRKTFVEVAQSLGMDQLVAPAAMASRAERDLNVVMVFQESSYNKYLSLFDGLEDTQPLLSGYKDRMELFPDFFTSFPGSINARFAAFTGLYPVPDYRSFTLQRVGVRSLFELLHDHGYACSLFYSSFCDYTGFRDFLKGRNIDEIYDAETMPGERKTKPVSWGLREEETLGAMQTRIKRYATEKQKFFLTYVPAAPHNPFDGTPARFCKSKPGEMGDFTPFYLNELRYMDWIICSIIDQLNDCGVLDKTLVVITDDHGELLGEDGGPIGHGWAVTPELANIPLIIMDPDKRGYRINDAVGSQVDLLPTILDLLGIPIPQEQLCQGDSLYSLTRVANRTIYLNSFRQYGIIKGQQLICGDRETPGAGDGRNIFAITNQGARTLFVATNATLAVPVSISSFDRFQENLLRHYSRYCQLMRQPVAGR